jgi:hypothetical protein
MRRSELGPATAVLDEVAAALGEVGRAQTAWWRGELGPVAAVLDELRGAARAHVGQVTGAARARVGEVQ